MPDGAQLPVQHGDDPGLRRVEHHVVPVEIPVEDRSLVRDDVLFEPRELFVEPVGVADLAPVVQVLDAGLLAREPAPVLDVALVVPGVFTEPLQADFFVVDLVDLNGIIIIMKILNIHWII